MVPLSLYRVRGGGDLGLVQSALAPDSRAVLAGSGRTRTPGARNSRHAGAGLRGNLVATGRGGAGAKQPFGFGAHAPGPGAQNGAAQPDRSTALGDGSARLGAGRSRFASRPVAGRPSVDGRIAH